MKIIPKKYFLIVLATILVIAFAFMSLYLNKKRSGGMKYDLYEKEMMTIEKQSESDDTDAIEKDLMDTDLDNVDKELKDIEKELDNVNY